MLATSLEHVDAPVQVVLAEYGIEAVVDLVEFLIEDGDNSALRLEPRGESLESRSQRGNHAGTWLVLQRLVPFFGVVGGAGAVEGGLFLGHLVVEVVLEGRVWGIGVPVAREDLNAPDDPRVVLNVCQSSYLGDFRKACV